MASITLQGNKLETAGSLPAIGSAAPDFKLLNGELGEVSLKDYQGKKLVLNIFPSIDTGVCATSVRRFNQDFFMGNVHAGKSAAVPSFFDGPVGGPGTSPAGNPQGAGWGCLQRNEPVYIDYASCIDGYIADETRMFCVGRMPEDMRAAYEAALAVEAAVLARARPGVLWEELYQCALEVVADAGLADFFMGPGPDRVRFVGHGVGLELDELPVLAPKLRQPLEAGRVFALEPTFVFPGGAVGIENTHLVEATGIRTLTRAPREIVCVS